MVPAFFFSTKNRLAPSAEPKTTRPMSGWTQSGDIGLVY